MEFYDTGLRISQVELRFHHVLYLQSRKDESC